MTEDKIEIVAQPTTHEKESEVRDTTIRKLQELVQHDLQHEHKHESRSKHKTKQNTQKRAQDEQHSDSSSDYDEDGFRVPMGKIPLDGQFSTEELEELVELGKEEGLLRDDIDVRIAEGNDVAKHLEVFEPHSETA